MVPIDIDDEVRAVIKAAAVCGEGPNQVLRRLLGLPAAGQGAAARREGELAALVAAGLIALGDPVFAIGSFAQVAHPAAAVAEDGHLLTADGTLHSGPGQLISALFGERFAAHGWTCLTDADGARLETLRQRHLAETTPHLLPHGPGELAPLIALRVLSRGDQLRLTLPDPRGHSIGSPAVDLATVTDDGCFLLPEGDRYPTAASAAAASLGPFITSGSWTTRDGRPVAALHQLARDAARSAE